MSLRRELGFEGALDLGATLAPLATGARDPTLRFARQAVARATRTPEGPATLALRGDARRVRAQAWGPGARWALERVPDLLGLGDGGGRVPEGPPVLRALARRARGVRLPRTHRVVELLVPIVLQQKVAGREASRAFRNLVLGFSERAPGPFEELWLPLDAEALRAVPEHAWIPLGVPARQGATLRRIAALARRVEEVDALPAREAYQRLTAIPGLGPWSASSALLHGLGDADAVPLGDYHLPHVVAWNLAGEPRADDARMLALLEPHRGQRGRVLRWILVAGRMPPRRGARRALRPLPDERHALWRSLGRHPGRHRN